MTPAGSVDRKPAPFPAVFIGGAGRSGTTMLGALLADALGGVATPESHFKHELPVDRWSATEAARGIAGHWRFRIWELDAPAPPDHVRSGTEYLSWLVANYAADHGVPEPRWWVDHTPENVLVWGRLFAMFPEAKGIHLVRDGRGVAASVRRLTWGPTTILGSARYWRARVDAGIAAEEAHPDRVLRVRYEELLEDPTSELDRIGAFLGATARADAAGGRFETPAYTQDQHRLVGRPPDPSRAQSWARALTPRQIELFEAEAGTLLAALGYPRRFESPRGVRPLERWGAAGAEAVQQHLLLPVRRLGTRGRYVAQALARRVVPARPDR